MSWDFWLHNSAAPTDVDDISDTVEGVFEALEADVLSIDLRGLQGDKVSGEHLTAILRTTFMLRDKVPGWADAVKVAEVALRRAGHDPVRVLIGLSSAADLMRAAKADPNKAAALTRAKARAAKFPERC